MLKPIGPVLANVAAKAKLVDTYLIPNGTADLVFSSDDAQATGKGWYFHAYFRDDVDKTSTQSWETKRDALSALAQGGVSFS